jgi:hypothetical protein
MRLISMIALSKYCGDVLLFIHRGQKKRGWGFQPLFQINPKLFLFNLCAVLIQLKGVSHCQG